MKYIVCVLLGLWGLACTSRHEQAAQQARQLLGQKKYTETVAMLKAEQQKAALNADLLNLLGYALFETGDYQQAIQHFNEAIKLDNKNYKFFYNRGNAYLQLKQPDEALKDFDAAIEREQSLYDLYLNRGTALAAMSRHKEALADFNKAEGLHKTDRNVYFNRGQTLMVLGEFDKAAADLHHCVELAPDFARAHYALARAEMEVAGKATDESCSHLARAAELGYAEAATLRAQACAK